MSRGTRPGPGFFGLGKDWTDASLSAHGLKVWTLAQALLRVTDAAPTQGHVEDTARTCLVVHGDDFRIQKAAESFSLFAGVWAIGAFQKVMTSHTYAAALMATDAPRDVIEDLEIQSMAFLVVVPNGLFLFEEFGVDFTRIAVSIHASGDAQMTLYDPSWEGDREPPLISTSGASLADVLFTDPIVEGSEDRHDLSPVQERLLALARRLVVGLLFGIQNAPPAKARTKLPNRGPQRRLSGEPAHRVVFVGAPLKLDLRARVREYLMGQRRGVPAVQVLVRGHFKRQVVGLGRGGRKVIWVQPYWRGPEEAPILVRPKWVGPREDG